MKKVSIVLFLFCISLASADLVGYWALDEMNGEFAFDGSGNAHHGTLENFIDPNSNWTAGKYDNCLMFDGTDYIDCGNSFSKFTKYTVSFWINMPVAQSSWTTHGGWVVSREIGYKGFGIAVGGQEPALYQSNGFEWTRLESDMDISLNQWHHIAGTSDGSVMSLYVDGVKLGSKMFRFEDNTDRSITIGSWSRTARCFQGQIDDVRVYDSALTEKEIRQIMIPDVPVDMVSSPSELFLNRNGNWITCYLQFPFITNALDVELSSVLLNNQISPERYNVINEDMVLMLMFPQDQVQELLGLGMQEIVVTGKILDGRAFKGVDNVLKLPPSEYSR